MTVASARLEGYQKKPTAITVIALIFLALPGVLLAQMIAMSGGSFDLLDDLMGSTYFFQEWLLCWSAAAAIYIVSTWSLAYFVLLSLYTVVRRVKALTLYPAFETPFDLLITAVWLSITIYVLFSTLKVPYLNPRVRWWTRPVRVWMCRRATVQVGQGEVPAMVLNLSMTGVFLKVDDAVPEDQPLPDRLGQTVQLRLDLGKGDEPGLQLAVPATLVWKGKADTPYRRGLGLQFARLPGATRRQLQRFLRDAARSAPRS